MARNVIVNHKTGKIYEYDRKWILVDEDTHSKLKTLSKEKKKPMSKIIFELLQ